MSWQSGSCEANGISIRFLQTGGSKPPVVLLHGLTGDGACWTPSRRPYRDDTPRGSGFSTRP